MSDTITDNLGLGGTPQARIDVFPFSVAEQIARWRGADDQSFGMVLVQYPGSNGETLHDNVLSWGYNIGPSGPIDPSEHTFAQTIESRYRTEAGLNQLEYYYAVGFPSGHGFRPFGITANLDSELLDCNFAADILRLGDKNHLQDGFVFSLAYNGMQFHVLPGSKIVVGNPSTTPEGISSALPIFADGPRSDTPFDGNPNSLIGNIVGTQGYWAIRTGLDDSFNVDVYNGGTPIAALSIAQDGVATHRAAVMDKALSADPPDPPEGHRVEWLAANGDIKVKVTVDGITKSATLLDFSALT